MAKSKDKFEIGTMSAKDAHETLSQLRRGRGGRTSKFAPVLEAVQGARKGQLVTVKGVAKNDVQAMRSYVYRYLSSEDYTVKSAREDEEGGTYTVVIGRSEDFA